METLHHVMLCAWMDTALHRTLDEATIVKVGQAFTQDDKPHLYIYTSYVHMHVHMYIHRHTYIPSEPKSPMPTSSEPDVPVR